MRASPDVSAEFEHHRGELFGIAYRVLGTVSEAEDVVQDAYLRYRRSVDSGRVITAPRAYLAAIVGRLAIDTLRSARVRREQYVGEWLPEPLLTEDQEPARVAEQADTVSMAALLLLERLSPVQRAAFVLHDVFGYTFEEIAEIVDRPAATCRQLAARARSHLRNGKPRFEAARDEQRRLAEQFFGALQHGEVQPLVELLTADIELHGDGGGKAPQWNEPIVGQEKVGRLLVAIHRLVEKLDLTIDCREINHAPGAIFRDERGRVVATWCLDIAEGRIQAIHGVTNPEKLGHLGPVGNAAELHVRRTQE